MLNPEKTNAMRLVIVGGVAAGASAAARARRLSENAQITILERGEDISFANCGLPYHIGGEIVERKALAIHTPQSLTGLLNIDIHVRTEATKIDTERKTVIAYDHKTQSEQEFPYDKLLLAPGAKPIQPSMPGIDDPRVLTLRNLQDMDKIINSLGKAQDVLVIGAGFIGLEMVEMLAKLNKDVHLVELQDQVLPVLDKDMVKHIQVELVDNNVDLILGDGISSFEPSDNKLKAHLNSGKVIETDLVILSIGVQCESQLASDANLELGIRKSIKVNEYLQTSNPDIYAAGDVAETADPILDKRVIVPLGGPANRQGRVAADHMFLGEKARPYPGTIGTSIVRIFSLAAGITGYSEKRLQAENINYKKVIVTANQHAGYYPGAVPVTLKIIWSDDNRLLGAQAYGFDGVDKRLDVLSTAIKGKLTVDDICHLELAYAPPFGSARDVINVAGFAAQNINDDLVKPVFDLPEDDQTQLIDVRPKEMSDLHPVPGAINIPMPMLRNKLDQLDPQRPVVTVCALGKMSYFASCVLKQNGFDVASMIGGMNVYAPKPIKKKSNKNGEQIMEEQSNLTPLQLDACGLACPGPIMRIKEALGELQDGQELIVKASDPGFASDFDAFCKANDLTVLSVNKDKGIITGHAKKSGQIQQTGAPVQGQKGATLVVFSCEMDKVLASFVIANGAAAMGGDVTMFFTFWGLNVLRKGLTDISIEKSFMDTMFGKMMPKGIDALPLSRMHMGGMGTRMMKWRMDSKNLPSLEGLMSDAQKAGVRMVACSMSMDAMGIQKDELIDGIEIGGVADFLSACNQTQTNLFI